MIENKEALKFSFIVCTYNRAKDLAKCLESICLQNYENSNFELLVVNNNSTDETTNIIESYKKNYRNINVKNINENTQGISFARNTGVRNAHGEFIIFIDDDETIDNEYLINLSLNLEKYPHTKLCCGAVIPVYESEKPKWMSPFTERLIGGAFFINENKAKKLKPKNYPGTGHTVASKELFDKYGYYNTLLGRKGKKLLGAEDKDMVFRWIENGIDCWFFPNIPVYHHIGKEKLSNSYFDNITYSIGVSERLRTLSISKTKYYKRLLNEAIKWCATIILYFFYYLTFTKSKGEKLILFRYNVTRGLLKNK